MKNTKFGYIENILSDLYSAKSELSNINVSMCLEYIWMLWMWFTVWDQYMKHSRKETINSVIWKEIKTRPLFIFQVKVAGAVLHQKTICSRLIVPTWREMAQLLIANKSKGKNLIYFRWQQPKNIEEVYWLVSTKVKWCWYGKRNCEHKPCSMAAHSSIQASLLGDR